ncbi:MAG: hypothetical protein R2706_00650 [Acidimicrobiales bacterium]
MSTFLLLAGTPLTKTSTESFPVPLPDGVVFPEMVVLSRSGNRRPRRRNRADPSTVATTAYSSPLQTRRSRSSPPSKMRPPSRRLLPILTTRAMNRARLGSGSVTDSGTLVVAAESVIDEAPTPGNS